MPLNKSVKISRRLPDSNSNRWLITLEGPYLCIIVFTTLIDLEYPVIIEYHLLHFLEQILLISAVYIFRKSTDYGL